MDFLSDHVIQTGGVLKGYGLKGQVGPNFRDKCLYNNSTENCKGKSTIGWWKGEVENEITEYRKL